MLINETDITIARLVIMIIQRHGETIYVKKIAENLVNYFFATISGNAIYDARSA